MKSYRKELWFNLPTRRGFINITPQVQECLRESGIMEGLALVNPMHITASVFINDDESGLHRDYEKLNAAQLMGYVALQFDRRMVEDGSALAAVCDALKWRCEG